MPSSWCQKMAALAYWLISLLKRGYHPSFKHSLGLPFPPTMHLVLDEQYLSQFKEILIIGDVHGCYDELEILLTKARAFHSTTLKIFAGDLVNKGPKNIEVIRKLRMMPSVLSVRGNHDEVVLREYYNSQDSNYKLKDKNKWIKDLTHEDADFLNNLPYTISLPSLNIVVVHAGLIPGVPVHFNNPVDMVNMRNVVVGDYFWRGGLRARKDDKEGEPWAFLWPGPDHVYFGHDAKRMLQDYPYATGLDTGCVYGNWLTGRFITGPRSELYVTVAACRVYTPPGGSKPKGKATL